MGYVRSGCQVEHGPQTTALWMRFQAGAYQEPGSHGEKRKRGAALESYSPGPLPLVRRLQAPRRKNAKEAAKVWELTGEELEAARRSLRE